MLWNGYSLITSKLWLNLSGNIWTERCWTAFYICQFHLDLGWACYHDGMPHRCKGTKCDHVQVRGRESGHRNVGLSRHRTRYSTWTKRLLLPSCKDRWRNPHLNRFLISLIPPLFFLFASWCVYLSRSLICLSHFLALSHFFFSLQPLSCSLSLAFTNDCSDVAACFWRSASALKQESENLSSCVMRGLFHDMFYLLVLGVVLTEKNGSLLIFAPHLAHAYWWSLVSKGLEKYCDVHTVYKHTCI